MNNQHKGLFSLYNTAIMIFFAVAASILVLIINTGFSAIDIQKQVVEVGVDEIRERLVMAGRISAAADTYSDEIMVTATPVRTFLNGSVNVDLQIMDVTYKLVQNENYIINYENIYVGSLPDKSYNSLRDALEDAKNHGIIENNPLVDEQKPKSTTAFIYWVINQNFDNNIDNYELAVLAIVYADKDRPTSKEQLIIQANVPEGIILNVERVVPDISSPMLIFGGTISESQLQN